MNKVEQVVCNKGTLYHVNDGYFYRRIRRNRTKLYLNCCKPGCGVKGVTDIHFRGPITLFNSAKHNHEPSRTHLAIKKFTAKVLKRCHSDTANIKKIFDEEVSKLPSKVISKLSYTTFLKVLRLKQSKTGSLPIVKSVAKYAKLLTTDHFDWLSKTRSNQKFFIDVIGNHTMLFISPTTKALTSKPNITYIIASNRTSNLLPKYFDPCTLVTILGIYDNKEIPFAFAVMKLRSVNTYRQLFNRILQELPAWNPSVIIADFESNIRNAIESVFQHAKVVGNWYHFSEDIRTRLFNLGLVPIIREDDDLHTYTKMCIALPLLPVTEIQLGFHLVKRLILSRQNTDEFIKLLNFIQQYWLNDVTPEHISVDYNPHRINNYCEEYTGFIVQLLSCRRAGKIQPNIIAFTDGLSKLENTYSAMYISAYKRIQTHGIVPKPLIKDLRIRNAVNNYRNGRSSLEEYLRALSATTLQITEYDIDGEFPVISTPNSCRESSYLNSENNNLSVNKQIESFASENDFIEEVIVEEVFFSDERLNIAARKQRSKS